MPSTGKFKAFKLTSVAGAYWRGDSNNGKCCSESMAPPGLPRERTEAPYLQRLEEAEKRDHRKLGKQLNLFHIQ